MASQDMRKIDGSVPHEVGHIFIEIFSAAPPSSEPTRSPWIRSCFNEGSSEQLFLIMQM